LRKDGVTIVKLALATEQSQIVSCFLGEILHLDRGPALGGVHAEGGEIPTMSNVVELKPSLGQFRFTGGLPLNYRFR
jgi:hypothetical protein